MSTIFPQPRTGVWIVGACGSVALTSLVGARAISRGLADTTGLVTAGAPFEGADLVELDALVFAGSELRSAQPDLEARDLAREGVLPAHLLEDLQSDLHAYAREIRGGLRGSEGLQGARRLQDQLCDFRDRHGLQRLVVVHLASTEAADPDALGLLEMRELDQFEALLERDPCPLPASVLYAWAAIDLGLPFLNFTPSLGAELPVLQQLARSRGAPLAGKDGKTGETLLKSVLAPMFVARNLRLLSWSGCNLLGNRDGQALQAPGAHAAKVRSKDVLKHIVGDQVDSHVRIDYVRSLGDWKTAWDLVHFEGFLGTRMMLQFTWQGCDSALAAPLILDLVRLLDAAQRLGRAGPVAELASFFKRPLGCEEHDFFTQYAALLGFAAELESAALQRAACGSPADPLHPRLSLRQ